MKPRVESTAKNIEQMIMFMNDASDELQRIANDIRKLNDISIASEAITCITNLLSKMRLDLLVKLPIRALQDAARFEKENKS